MPRIFKYGNIPNITFTPDKELNILIYRLPSYLIIYRSHTHTLLKMVRFLAHPVYRINVFKNFRFITTCKAHIVHRTYKTAKL